MLSYTSLLVVCLVLSAVAYFIYKIVTDSSRSVYRSKQPLALSDTEDHLGKKKPVNQYPKSKSAAFGRIGEVAPPGDFARTYPAMPTGSVDFKWEGAGVQLREVEVPHGNAANKSHCSLYEANPTDAVAKPNPNNGRLHREEADKPAGRTYKVTRRSRRSYGHDERDLSKPWGW